MAPIGQSDEPNPNLEFHAEPEAEPQLNRLQAVLDRFEVSIAEAQELCVLEDYELVVIADDSGSMNCPAAPLSQRQLGERPLSRWDELKETVSLMVDIGTCLDRSGIDVFFLNRGHVLNVKSSSDAAFRNAFSTPPTGTTPLTETLQRVCARLNGERPVLMVILTDGEPNGGATKFCAELKRAVQNPQKKVKVQIMACTGEDEAISWLNTVDKQFVEVDVTDDYYSEKVQVLQKVRRIQKFTHGDWVMKAMLGCVSRKFDGWDEKSKSAFNKISIRTQSFHEPCKCKVLDPCTVGCTIS